jgi:hypothetical protein
VEERTKESGNHLRNIKEVEVKRSITSSEMWRRVALVEPKLRRKVSPLFSR